MIQFAPMLQDFREISNIYKIENIKTPFLKTQKQKIRLYKVCRNHEIFGSFGSFGSFESKKHRFAPKIMEQIQLCYYFSIVIISKYLKLSILLLIAIIVIIVIIAGGCVYFFL